MGKFIFLAIFLFSTIGRADFSGPWSGSGKAVDALEKEFVCSSFKVAISQSEQSVVIHNGYFGCSPLEMPWEFPRFEIDNNVILFKGQKIGSITADRIKFDVNLSGYIQRVDIFLEKNGSLSYREFWINSGSNSHIMGFEGSLTRARDANFVGRF